MTRYFMRGTSLQQAELDMMTPPYEKTRGYGIRTSTFRYKKEDVECELCLKYNRKKPCTLSECEYLEERIEAQAVNLGELLFDCLSSNFSGQLKERLHDQFDSRRIAFFLHQDHWERWSYYHSRYFRKHNRLSAALFLLSAYPDVWRRVVWKISENGFDFQTVGLRGIGDAEYCVYQAAKSIATGSINITFADLAFPDLVSDEAFRLIICALLLARFGDAVLNLEGKSGDIE